MNFLDAISIDIENEFNYLEVFIELLKSESIKYSEFNANFTNYKDELSSKAGVYHFFSVSDKNTLSLYVGKAGRGKNKEWNLYQRLMQHRQASQTDTIHGAIAKELGSENEKVIKFLCDSEIYIQYIGISENESSDVENLIKDIEHYCIQILNPRYTDK
jgi:superfamily II DNA or RNA helicase